MTNDSWSPLRAERRYQPPRPDRRARRFSRARAHRPTATQGRWSLAAGLFAGGEPDRRALAELLLERHGIVTRDAVRAEGIAGGYAAVYGELRALETLGSCRRGYFVEGLGGAQFALGGAVERLRELRPRDGDEPEPLVLAAADPGAALRRGRSRGRSVRARARRGWRERTSCCSAASPRSSSSAAAARSSRCGSRTRSGCGPRSRRSSAFVKRGGAKRLAVERFDGKPVTETEVMPLLVEAGFLAGPRRAVLRA